MVSFCGVTVPMTRKSVGLGIAFNMIRGMFLTVISDAALQSNNFPVTTEVLILLYINHFK